MESGRPSTRTGLCCLCAHSYCGPACYFPHRGECIHGVCKGIGVQPEGPGVPRARGAQRLCSTLGALSQPRRALTVRSVACCESTSHALLVGKAWAARSACVGAMTWSNRCVDFRFARPSHAVHTRGLRHRSTAQLCTRQCRQQRRVCCTV